MAFPGIGYRTTLSLAMEMALHLLEPIVYTSTLSAVASAGTATISVGNLGYPINCCYSGAQLVIDSELSEELISVISANPNTTPPTITATFALPHAANVSLLGATFPMQATSGDYFFSQSEILSYIARAQNQFLADVPMIYSINYQNVQYGQVLQPLVCNAIEIARIASSSPNVALASLTRLNGTVTAVSQSPHGLIPNEKFAIFQSPDPNFDGAFRVGTVVSPTSWTYAQQGANETISGGGWAGLWLRLLEVSQEQLSMQNPQWESQFTTTLKSWWEDRAGLYAFGVGGRPSSNLPVEILCAIRDTDTLQFTDGFLCPDPMLHYVKYKALEYAASKDGEQRSPQLQAYCKARYDRGVLTSRRWLGWTGGLGGRAEQQMAMAGAGSSGGKGRR